MTEIGWIGAGRMGAAMAGRLLDAGRAVRVWNRTRAKAEALVPRGATVAGEVTDLGGCDVVFVMVSTSDALREVLARLYSGENLPGTVVDCSTVSAEASA